MDALAVAQPGDWLVQADAPVSTRLQQVSLAEAVHRPRVLLQAWLKWLRELLDGYDEDPCSLSWRGCGGDESGSCPGEGT